MLFRRFLLRIYHRAHRDHREAFLNPLSVISVGSVVDFAFCRSKLQRELLKKRLQGPLRPYFLSLMLLGQSHVLCRPNPLGYGRHQ